MLNYRSESLFAGAVGDAGSREDSSGRATPGKNQ